MAGVKAPTVPTGRMLSADDVAPLEESCDSSTPAGARDRARLGLLACDGLGRAELVALDLADFTDGHDGSDSGTLLVRGKGNKERSLLTSAGRFVLDEAPVGEVELRFGPRGELASGTWSRVARARLGAGDRAFEGG